MAHWQSRRRKEPRIPIDWKYRAKAWFRVWGKVLFVIAAVAIVAALIAFKYSIYRMFQ